MAWSAPATFTAGQIVGASDLNAITADMNYVLSGRGYTSMGYVVGADLTITASTYTDFDATNLLMNITVNSGRIMGLWSGPFLTDNTAHNNVSWISTRLDGSVGDAAGSAYATTTIGQGEGISAWEGVVPFAFSGLSAGSHAVRLVGKTDGSTGAYVKVRGNSVIYLVRGLCFEI